MNTRKIELSLTKMCYIYRALLSGAAKACLAAKPNETSMTRSAGKTVRWLFVAGFLALVTSSAAGQAAPPPLLQDIQVARERYSAVPSATPLVMKTGSVVPNNAVLPNPNGVRTLFPALAEVSIPGYSGILIESLDGNVVFESNPEAAFNPASNVKIATAYAVLKTFGPEFRFMTNVFTDGAIDRTTGTLTGNVYVSGKDPMFGYEHAVAIAHELNKLGVRTVTGDLIVTDNFVMNYS